MGALVSGNGRYCSHLWERLWVLLLLGTVAVALVAGSVHGCYHRWERSPLLSSLSLLSLLLLLLGSFMGDLVDRNGCCCSRCCERSWVLSPRKQFSVAFVRSGRRCQWISSEAVFIALFGRKPANVIELA